MPIDSIGSIVPLARLNPLVAPQALASDQPVVGGFASVFSHLLAESQQANAAATAAIEDLATGKAEDLHTVTLAVAQADVSFRMILEMRNRLSDALQEITRMQV
ncbi:MAG TPA: flagellar hook-basal body complex protein FliE [Gemmata sp.]|jgi:flagellar hook-basal body complex protein FliE|nr:flagellar hook-basal body complex protein FliE [Gemmata sp.]